MYIAPGQEQTTPRGQNFNINRNVLSVHSFVASFKKNSLPSDFIQFFLNDLIHVYSSRAGTDSPQGTKFWCQQKRLVTLFICSKFQNMSLKSDFIQPFFHVIHVYSSRTGAHSPQAKRFWCQQKGLITFPICCKFQITEKTWKHHFLHRKSNGKKFPCPRANNSKIDNPIRPNFEVIRAFMTVLVFRKFYKDPIKGDWEKLET